MTRILVARLDSVGDVLVSGPAVRAVAASGAEVVLLAGPQGASAAGLLPGVDEVLIWECPWITDPARAVDQSVVDELLTLVRAAGVDEAVVLTSFHQSPLPLALLLRLAGVGRISGASVDYAGRLLDVRLRPGEDFPEDQPEPVRALRIAEAAGFALPPEDDGRLRVREHGAPPADVGEPGYVVVHPGAAVPARTWPAGHHAATVDLLTGRGVRVVVTGGPGELALTAAVAGATGTDLGGRTDLGSLAAVLRGAAAVVVGNTGAAHLAAAVGTPVVSLFSAVVPHERWAPYGVPTVLLGDQHAPCAGSRARVCPVPRHPCLTSVHPEQVVDAVFALTGPIGGARTFGSATIAAPRRKEHTP
ncbi:glycosyltransferase family 9 protein [Labedella populi]|uniref:Glycosyltransferase family 9 protein n=1 Tax=Labedella populi TaxID=2498850 RepID=A0A444QC33_9MICO|nr:glycosyltransferase family 9 protein [Labedella populi]RWZ61572.1 glycosyltransferase family 9 protein [Labedella populi]